MQVPSEDPSEFPYDRSDPRAQLDPAWSDLPTMEAPEDEPEGVADPASARRLVIHDLATGRSMIREGASEGGSPESTGPSLGELAEDLGGLNELGRSEVINTTAFPQRAMVKLYMSWPDGAVGACTGTLIGSRSVLSAAHCIHSPDHGGWASSVTAIPGMDREYAPFGTADAVNLSGVEAYIEDRDRDHDLALITLDRELGNVVGWLGLRSHSEDTLEDSRLVMDGYPGESYDGLSMINAPGSGEDAVSEMVYYSLESEGGYSGSGVRVISTDDHVSAINTRSDCYRFPFTWSRACGPRITSDRISMLLEWIATDADLPLIESDQTGWTSLGGATYGNVVPVKTGARDLDLFVRGLNGAVHRQHWSASAGYSGWTSLGGTMPPQGAKAGEVAAVSRSEGQLDLFALGSDSAVWTKAIAGGWPGTPWPDGTGWASLGGRTEDAPAAVSSGPWRLDVFVRGLDDALWWQYWAENGWSGWLLLGGPQITGAPSAVSWGADRVDVVARGKADGTLVSFSCSGPCTSAGDWEAPRTIDGVAFGEGDRPTLVSSGEGKLDVLIRGLGGDVWHAAFRDGFWWGWESLGGYMLEDVGATVRGEQIELFVRGGDQAIYAGLLDVNGRFAGWWWIGGGAFGSPTALAIDPNTIDVFFRDDADRPRTRRWTSSAGWAL